MDNDLYVKLQDPSAGARRAFSTLMTAYAALYTV